MPSAESLKCRVSKDVLLFSGGERHYLGGEGQNFFLSCLREGHNFFSRFFRGG